MSGSDDENSIEEEETENVIDDDLIEVDVEETVITTTEKRSRVGSLERQKCSRIGVGRQNCGVNSRKMDCAPLATTWRHSVAAGVSPPTRGYVEV